MEHLQFKATSEKHTFEKQWIHKENWVVHISEMWDPIHGDTDCRFFRNKKAWRIWLFSLHEVVMEWDGFDSWDWGGFSDVKTLNIDSLLGPDFRRLAIRLLAMYVHSFITRLGFYPSPLLRRPLLAVPSCQEHRRKFGHGYVTNVML